MATTPLSRVFADFSTVHRPYYHSFEKISLEKEEQT